MLLFKARFLGLIRTGRKTQTIRLWRHARVKPGQRAFVPGLGRVRITAVERLAALANLTRADARADGFATRRQMLAEIRRLYAGVTDRAVWRVRFAWEPAAHARDIQRPTKSQTPRPQRAAPRAPRTKTAFTRQPSLPATRRRQLTRFILALDPNKRRPH